MPSDTLTSVTCDRLNSQKKPVSIVEMSGINFESTSPTLIDPPSSMSKFNEADINLQSRKETVTAYLVLG